MKEYIKTIMSDYATQVIFLHVLSASIWVGGMIALWFLTKKSSESLIIERRFASRAALFKKFFYFLVPFIILLFITAFCMAVGYQESAVDLNGFTLDEHKFEIYKYINAKGTIWLVMLMNMVLMTWILSKASCVLCKTQKSTDCMWLISTYLLPINIILGIVAMYIGAFLRNSF